MVGSDPHPGCVIQLSHSLFVLPPFPLPLEVILLPLAGPRTKVPPAQPASQTHRYSASGGSNKERLAVSAPGGFLNRIYIVLACTTQARERPAGQTSIYKTCDVTACIVNCTTTVGACNANTPPSGNSGCSPVQCMKWNLFIFHRHPCTPSCRSFSS